MESKGGVEEEALLTTIETLGTDIWRIPPKRPRMLKSMSWPGIMYAAVLHLMALGFLYLLVIRDTNGFLTLAKARSWCKASAMNMLVSMISDH